MAFVCFFEHYPFWVWEGGFATTLDCNKRKTFDFHERFVHHTMLKFHALKFVSPPLTNLLDFQKFP